MARVESSTEGDQVKKLEKEVASLKKKVKKSGKKKMGCLGTGGILVVLAFLLIVYFTAKTGIVNIPIVTPLVYTEPEPTYWLDPLSIPDVDIQQLAQQQVEGRLLSVITGRTKTIPVRFSEEELTGSIRKEQNKEGAESDAEYTQVLLLDDVMEFFTIMGDDGRQVTITMTVQPMLEDGDVDIKVLSFKVGAATIPKGIGQLIINSTVEPVLDTSIAFAKDIGRISDITIKDGEIQIDLEIQK